MFDHQPGSNLKRSFLFLPSVSLKGSTMNFQSESKDSKLLIPIDLKILY